MSHENPLESVEVSLSPLERFEEYLQSRGMRMTRPRRILVEQVFSHHEHFDADALIEQLAPKGSPDHVGRATVYRTLKEFVDAGLLHKFELDGRAVYEHDYGYPQHDHLYCMKCQKLFEFQSDDLIKLRDEMARQQNFRVTGHRLIITGVCQACSRERNRTKRKLDRI